MPSDTKAATPKLDNNRLVWIAVAKQMDITAEFRLIWNKLDHVRLVEDMGVGTRNAASKRFHRWIGWMVEQSAQLNGGIEHSAETADKGRPITRSGLPLEAVSESSKTRAEKKEYQTPESVVLKDEDLAPQPKQIDIQVPVIP
ncbi:hypothetical protein EYC80_000595 [Monilinia laxa]|uniref:Uncharacterized protein n=1 Tax=Monilinia laxa TaxID=61186 RepID=A0A5N6KBB6_MONLA|nr:hypothetical protein EYC80_000595 [Monilinia laxa]